MNGLDAERITSGSAVSERMMAAARHTPESLIAADSPLCESWSGWTPRVIRAGEADAMADAIAARLALLGLREGDTVVAAFPGCAMVVPVAVAMERAGVRAVWAPISLTDDEARDLAIAVGASAVMTVTQIEDLRPAAQWVRIAGAYLALNHILALGSAPPAGVIPLERQTGLRVNAVPSPFITSHARAQEAAAATSALLNALGPDAACPIVIALQPSHPAARAFGIEAPVSGSGPAIWLGSPGGADFAAARDGLEKPNLLLPAGAAFALEELVGNDPATSFSALMLAHAPGARPPADAQPFACADRTFDVLCKANGDLALWPRTGAAQSFAEKRAA